MSLYGWTFRHIIAHTDTETAHEVCLKAIACAGRFPLTAGLMRATIGHLPAARDAQRPLPRLGGREVRGRLGLAAGMDKNAEAVLGMTAMGFGFVEVGTTTPKAQPGNDKPRSWRLIADEGLRNRMGFNNEGAEAAAANLRRTRRTRAGRAAIIGANIGKNKVTAEADAPEDYRTCARVLSPLVDFVVVNVSSPNTPGLRDLQSVESLRPILVAAQEGIAEGTTRPVSLFVKIAPDLADEEIVDVVRLSGELGLDGVVATNTTIDHDLGEGGVSGQPLFPRALEVVTLVARHLGDDQTLIATGGIKTPEQARAMLDAGADLVEGFSAFVFEGPFWPGKLNRALTRY